MSEKLTIDPEFRELCRQLLPEERSLLEASIESEGCRDAIVTWANHSDTILDGHNRYEICTQLQRPFKTKAITFPDRQACIEWIISNQLGKRNLTNEEKSFLRGKRYRAEKKAQGGTGANQHKQSAQNEQSATADRLAVEYNTSPATIRRDADFADDVDAIAANVGPEAKQEILSGQSGLSRKQIQEVADAEPDKQPEKFQTAKKAHVANASGENEWYTPPEFIERARQAMGGIDLDPASCKEAQKVVKAKRFYDILDDGLSKKWKGRVWMNPPYSKDACSKFAEKLLAHAAAGDISQACVLVNNATETAWMQPMLRTCAAVCFPEGRIKFHDKTGKPANSPLQGQAILYFGSNRDDFEKAFSDIGPILFDTSGGAATEIVAGSAEPSACDRYEQRLIEWTKRQLQNIDDLSWSHAMGVWAKLADMRIEELESM